MKNTMIELNDVQLNTISGGHHHCQENKGLGGLLGLLNSLEKKGFGNLALNISIIIISNSYIGGDLVITTTQGNLV